MSSRDATLNIHNNTPYTLTLSSAPSPKDGVYATSPPSTIAAGATGTFKVAKTSNASAHGPEGHCYYTFSTGPETVTVDIYWNHPDNDNPSIYTATESPNRGTCSTSITDGGHDQTVEYYINFSTTALHDYSMIVALTATTLDTGLLGLQQQGLIAKALTSPATSGAVPQVSLTRLGAPTVVVPNGQYTNVQLQVHVTAGTLTWNNGGGVTSTSLNGATLCFDVPLSLSRVTDLEGAIALPGAKSQLQSLAAQGLAIYGLFLDWTHNVTGLSVTGVSLPSGALTALQQALRGYTAPPWPVGYSAQSPGSAPTSGPLPGFVPTAAEASATPNTANERLGTVNLLAMCMGGALPNSSSRKSFTSPLVTSASDYGMIVFDAHLFDVGYLRTVILDALGEAMKETVGATSAASLTGSVPSWTLSSTWTNSGHNGGKGDKVAEDNQVDVYVKETLSAYCTVTVTDHGTTSGQLVLTASGYLDDRATSTKYPLIDGGLVAMDAGTVEYKQTWTAVFTLSGGDSGTIAVQCTVSSGNVETVQDDQGFMESAGDWVRGLFSDDATVKEGMEDQYGSFASTLASKLEQNLKSAVQATTGSIVLPTGQKTSCSGLHMDSACNVYASFTILA